MLTVPGHGLLPAVEAIPHARRGYEDARSEAEQRVSRGDDVEPFRSASCRGSTTSNRDFWTGGARRRVAVLALPGLRLLHPSAAADVPDRPLEEPADRSGVGTRDARDVLDQLPELDARAGAAVHRRDRRDRRAAVGAAHDEPRELRARRRARSACRCASCSSTTPIPTATSTFPCSSRSAESMTDVNDDHRAARVHHGRRPVRDRAAACTAIRWS